MMKYIILALHLFFELLALIGAGLWCWRRSKGKFHLFVPFLFYTLANEIIGYVCNINNVKNYFLYTIYVPFAFAFYSYLITIWINDRRLKTTVSAIMALGILTAVYNALWGEGFMNFNHWTTVITGILTIINCLIYLFDLLRRTDITTSPAKIPEFWIIAGILFYSFCSLLAVALHEYCVKSPVYICGVNIFNIVLLVPNLLIYGSFVISFRLCYKRTMSIS